MPPSTVESLVHVSNNQGTVARLDRFNNKEFVIWKCDWCGKDWRSVAAAKPWIALDAHEASEGHQAQVLLHRLAK